MQVTVVSPTHAIIFDKVEHNYVSIGGHPAWGMLYDLNTDETWPFLLESNSFCASGLFLSNGMLISVGRNPAAHPDRGAVSQPQWELRHAGHGDRDARQTVVPHRSADHGWLCAHLLRGDGERVHEQHQPSMSFFPSKPTSPIKFDVPFLNRTLNANLFVHALSLPGQRAFIISNTQSTFFNWGASLPQEELLAHTFLGSNLTVTAPLDAGMYPPGPGYGTHRRHDGGVLVRETWRPAGQISDNAPSTQRLRTSATPPSGPVTPNHSMPVPVNVIDTDASGSLEMCSVEFTALASILTIQFPVNVIALLVSLNACVPSGARNGRNAVGTHIRERPPTLESLELVSVEDVSPNLLMEHRLKTDICAMCRIQVINVSVHLTNGDCFVIGHVYQYHENSKYCSAHKPSPNHAVDICLLHIMPALRGVFEESDADVCATGRDVTIFINDDRMQLGLSSQLLPPAKRLARQAFYAQHGVGWVMCPKHHSPPSRPRPRQAPCPHPRTAALKASNMNYGLALSLKVGKFVLQLVEEQERERVQRAIAAGESGVGVAAAGAGVGASLNSAHSGATALTTTTTSSALTAADVELDIEETFEEN
ncbi:hypothetical protein JB92DRAFT_3094236 [Gautieria morchelliformis]|nr:hypothetical protein JB92DRAFT_3094236 [Gautieria morchelliformis]